MNDMCYVDPIRVIFYDYLTCMLCLRDDISYVMMQGVLCYKLYYEMIMLCYRAML